MDLVFQIKAGVSQAIQELYQVSVGPEELQVQPTRKEFSGDFTLVIFPLVKKLGQGPEQIGQAIGQHLLDHDISFAAFNLVKGFLNLSLSTLSWTTFLNRTLSTRSYGHLPANGKKVLVEFSSPNTNKPLHLGHVRNILLGWSCSNILRAAGNEVKRVQIVNDRGIAICKSMLAWQRFGEGKTPEEAGIKSDHFVGDYYVEFEKRFQEEYKAWRQEAAAQEIYLNTRKADQSEEDFFKAYKNTYFNEHSALGREARDMLQLWEANDPATRALWKRLNDWVYEGFERSYTDLGVSFDKLYYESDTYLLGKEIIDEGLAKGIFYRKEDGSVWIDLTEAGLDHKLVLRKDGTSVYITQDIGTARVRYEDFGAESMVYVVADEQNYHFQVLFEIMKRLGEPYSQGLHHLSYGMVDLPTGKMKSREGTVVDADDLIAEVKKEAADAALEKSDLGNLSQQEQDEIVRKIGMAALKFHIIKVNPAKRMTFDPKESVDMQGQTGPYIQNAYVRVQSILRKAGELPEFDSTRHLEIADQEREILGHLYAYPAQLAEAAEKYDPSVLANYCYALARAFHRFYHDLSILQAEEPMRTFRLHLIVAVAQVLKDAMQLLGIEMPERM